MEHYINTFASLLPLILTILLIAVMIGSVVFAVYKGLVNRKKAKNLTVTEQEKDLENYMKQECCKVEKFSVVLKATMKKEEITAYKKMTVLQNVSMYAKASDYKWYVEEDWSVKIDQFVQSANEVAKK